MKILLYISKFYSISIFKGMVEYLELNDISYRFYTSRKVRNVFPENWDKSKILLTIDETKLFKPDFVLCPGNHVDFRIPGIKVQVFHGIGIEKPSHYIIRHFFDLYLTSGPVVTKKYLELQKKYKYFDVKETGWLKMDYIINYDMTNFKADFDIPENKKIILYAPTFSNSMESGSKMLDNIDKIVKSDEFWLVKFHEFMNKELVEKFKSKAPKNLKIVETNDITPYLHVADIMISDTSSVVYEFICLKKPVITIDTISRKDKGIDVSTPQDLRDALDRILKNPDLLKLNIEKHILEVNPYLDGKTVERTFDVLREILKNGDLPRKGKPINFFRKFQIIYKSIFKKGYLK
ncbi:MAG: CDP-glycerol glycerophosphotransferase family protein [Candidatus Delongbacteria bacterium]|nr:CDP-glycerol glycerophosphotransferase family protein [Candidatus Delongbacteria bacterium]MBN2835377.1 CDP-glycerol glycerophosphotransferase family protein [Candidatus Delongbacteria bacterium]